MRKILFGVIITLVIVFTFKYCGDKQEEQLVLKESTSLIQKQINNVGKLVVSEGNFSEVFTYKSSKDIFGDLLSAEKKALVVVNAEVTIAYDLSKIEFDIDEVNKILTITNIPEEELKVHPDLEYYDVQADYLNPFEAKDYNAINNKVKDLLKKKIAASDMKNNAKNRLISELSKFYILTSSLGWTLQYNETPIATPEALEVIKLKI